MYYRKKQYPKKVMKRVMRRKRTRYHNDAAFFDSESYSTPRKRSNAMRKRRILAAEVHRDAEY